MLQALPAIDTPPGDPLFSDLDEGLDFLAQLPLGDPPRAEELLHGFLDGLLHSELGAEPLFVLLEHAAEPLYFVREAQARLYQGKALQLNEDEETHFRRGSGIWQKVVDAYGACLGRVLGEQLDSRLQEERVASLLHRCLHYLALCGRDHFLARRQLPEGFWRLANDFYARAEALGVAEARVEKPLAEIEGRSQRCIDAYVTLLLLDLASPYGRSLGDFNLIWMLADHWAPLVSLQPLGADQGGLPHALVDLQADLPLQFLSELEGEAGRYRVLECTELICQLKQSGRDSALLPPGLGELDRQRLETLRHHLLKAWFPRPLGRRFPRSMDSGVVEVGMGLQQIHALIRADGGVNWNREDIDFLLWDQELAPAHAGLLLDHSPTGFRLLLQPPFAKVAHGQLLTLRPHDGCDFLLAQVQWLIQCQDGSLMVGLTLLPGRPRAVAVRSQGRQAFFQRAFLLPGMEALGAPPSLVLPVGLYQTQGEQTLELYDGSSRRLRLVGRLQSGADFERVSYRD